jgi:hypothetical protein
MRTPLGTAGLIVAALCLTACEADNTTPTGESAVGVKPKATIAAAPAHLRFRIYAFVPAADPPAQTLAITNRGEGTMEWTARARARWIALGPASGTAPSQLQVGLDRAALAPRLADRPSSLRGVISLRAAGASNTPIPIWVTIEISYLSPGKVAPGGGPGPRPPS